VRHFSPGISGEFNITPRIAGLLGLAAQMSASSRPLAAADFTALSVEPFLNVESQRTFARVGLLLNAGAPGSADIAPFGFHVGGGARF
jgi:hypothetical protein